MQLTWQNDSVSSCYMKNMVFSFFHHFFLGIIFFLEQLGNENEGLKLLIKLIRQHMESHSSCTHACIIHAALQQICPFVVSCCPKMIDLCILDHCGILLANMHSFLLGYSFVTSVILESMDFSP